MSGICVALLCLALCACSPELPGAPDAAPDDLTGEATRTPENTSARCQDGKDNDRDGYSDCLDQDCHGFAFCQDLGAPDSKRPDTNRDLDATAPDQPAPADGPPDNQLSEAAPPDASAVDLPQQDGGGSCVKHHDCAQGWFCYLSQCVLDPKMKVFHCGKAGCPPGSWCVDQVGKKSVCAEDKNHKCASACDCGPAHCCKAGVCVKDTKDPLQPGGVAVGTACDEGTDATYCCTAPSCHPGRYGYGVNASRFFRCHNLKDNSAQSTCGGSTCFGTSCNCTPGEACVDTESKLTPGQSCQLLSGGTCVSAAAAVTFYGYTPSEVLTCCGKGCPKGTKCEVGWQRLGGRLAYTRVVGTCGSCGDGKCGDGEYPKTCPADCSCGDGKCAPQEVGQCNTDCGHCGDGKCQPWETPYRSFGGVASGNHCQQDCPHSCGDGWCSGSETAQSCAKDCAGGCVDAALFPGQFRVCGDGVCSTQGCVDAENCRSCPQDCGACGGWTKWGGPALWTTKTINSVWGSSRSDVFAVGASGTILRYDGAKWSPVFSGVTDSLNGVWGLSASVIYAVGGTSGGFPASRALRYDGKTWSSIGSWSGSLVDVWAGSPTEVYTVGTDACKSMKCKGEIRRYDGKSWTTVLSGQSTRFIDVWGSGGGQVVAVGYDPHGAGTGQIHRWDGATWHHLSLSGSWALRFVWGSSATDVHALGYKYVQGKQQGIIAHFDGTSWSVANKPSVFQFGGLWGVSATEVYAGAVSLSQGGGATSYEMRLLRFDGKTWALHGAKLQGLKHRTVTSLWATPGSPRRFFATGGGVGPIFQFDGQTWKTPLAKPPDMLGVWGSAATNVVAVGEAGTIKRFDGKQWSAAAPVTKGTLMSVWGSSASSVLATGYLMGPGKSVEVLRFNGASWSVINTGVTKNLALRSIWGSSASDVFAVGGLSAEAVHYTGGSWHHSHLGQSSLEAIWGSAATNILAVGYHGMVVHYDGNKWTPLSSKKQPVIGTKLVGYKGIWGSSPTNVMVVGMDDKHAIIRFDGSSWHYMQHPTKSGVNLQLRGIWGASATEVYAVGGRGVILRSKGGAWEAVPQDLREVGSGAYVCPDLNAVWASPAGDVFVAGNRQTLLRRCPQKTCP